MTDWKVIYYQTARGEEPVVNFIKKLPKEDQEKIIWTINLLERHGLKLGSPYLKKLEGTKKLWELKQKAGKIQKILREKLIVSEQGEGQVKVTFNGEQKLQNIEIADALLAPERKEELLRLLKNGITDAVSRAQQVAANEMKEIAGDLNIPGL